VNYRAEDFVAFVDDVTNGEESTWLFRHVAGGDDGDVPGDAFNGRH